MRCPRCQRASPNEAVFCPGCGAPLAFRAEPTPRPLDLSLSLDRRAGARELALDPPLDAARSVAWDLGPAPAALAVAYPPAAAIPAHEADDLEFGPIPELAPDLEPGPALALEPASALAEPEPSAELEPRALGAPEPAEARPLARALGLAPDPVVPDDLGFAGVDEGPGGEPPAADLGAGSADGDRRGVLDRELDLALDHDLGSGAADDRALDLALPAAARPDQLPLPLREPGPRLRSARPGRRAAAWAVDAAPLLLLWAGGLTAVYDRVPLSPGDRAGLLERVLRDGGALALPLLAGVATLALVHQTLAHALAGATLGKWLLGLRVVSADGARPSVGRCAGRAALSAASVLLLGLGLLPALFTRSGRTLHDISAGTRVVESP